MKKNDTKMMEMITDRYRNKITGEIVHVLRNSDVTVTDGVGYKIARLAHPSSRIFKIRLDAYEKIS